MKLSKSCSTIFDRTLDLLFYAAFALVPIVMLLVVAEVTSRNLLAFSIIWLPEITEYSLLYITFLGTAWLLRRDGHVKMDIVVNRLNPRSQALVNLITTILGAMGCLVLAVYGARITLDHFQRGVYMFSMLKPPAFLILAIIPIGSFLLFIQFLRKAYGHAMGVTKERAKVYEEQ